MKAGDVMSFEPGNRDRERLPGFVPAVIGREIECFDQCAILRILPRDRVRVEELRGDEKHVLVSHSAHQGRVWLTTRDALKPVEELAL